MSRDYYVHDNGLVGRLQLQIRRKKKLAVVLRVPLPAATNTDERCSMDFVFEQLAGSKAIAFLV